MRSQYLPVMALVMVSLVAALLVWGELADSRGRVDEAVRLMEAQGNAIADIVGESSLHGLEVFSLLEREQQTHLLDNANWLAWVDGGRALSEADLDKFAADLDLWRIMIFDRNGELERSSRPAGAPRRGSGRLPDSFLLPLISGRERSGILGGQQARMDSTSRMVAGVARPGGGAVVVSSRLTEVERARGELSPGHLIQSLGHAHGLVYVVLQNRNGTIASSTTELGFALPGEDGDLKPLLEGRPFVTRRFASALGPVLEVARVLPLKAEQDPSRAVLLRVGLAASLLDDLERDLTRRTWLRLLVTGAGLVLMAMALLAWQRQRVLGREVEKISRALALQEEENRRTEKLAAMGNLAAGVAHEIRNPLNTIHMIAQRFGRIEDLDDGLRSKATQIRDESRRIEGIVQQFLDFARPREPVYTELDLARVVQAAVAVHRSARDKERFAIRCDAPASLPARLDAEMVKAIVDNLVRNGLEAQPEGGWVNVQLERVKAGARLVVSDGGPGVPAADRGRIFDLYFTTKPTGTGLGLGLVSRMVSALGGHLELGEGGAPGQGAVFVVSLPLDRSDT